MTVSAIHAVGELIRERTGRKWCLFLDRDGVINRRIVGDYVRDRSQFEWLPGAVRAVKELRVWAPYLVIVTNQQGVSKGLMRSEDVASTHRYLQEGLTAQGGGTVDSYCVCPHLASAGCACRKPQPGLVMQWLEQHSDSEPRLSIVVGDSTSDLELARNVAAITGGCGSVYIGDEAADNADVSFPSLWEFARAVGQAREMEKS